MEYPVCLLLLRLAILLKNVWFWKPCSCKLHTISNVLLLLFMQYTTNSVAGTPSITQCKQDEESENVGIVY